MSGSHREAFAAEDSERPPWLADEPGIVSLLHAVLDRFDRQPAAMRERQVYFLAEKQLPVLDKGDAAADQVWALILDLARRGVLTVRQSRRNALDPPWREAKLGFSPQCEAVLRAWLQRERAETAFERWGHAVKELGHLFPGTASQLLNRRIVMQGRTPEEILTALGRLATVDRALTLRQLSALVFWGDSKILDDRGDLVSALFPALEVLDRAIVVAIFLPATVRGVLFIENQDTYTAATRGQPSAVEGLALVFASGFRGSAARVRTQQGCALHYAGPGTAQHLTEFERWWFEGSPTLGPCAFWGDLDFAGMRILSSLRSRFGAVSAWQPGYDPMLRWLEEHGGHRSHIDLGLAQTDPGTTGCVYADSILLPSIRRHGQVDQELSG